MAWALACVPPPSLNPFDRLIDHVSRQVALVSEASISPLKRVADRSRRLFLHMWQDM